MVDALQAALQGDAFMPHGMCYLWQPELLWLHVVSDGLIAAAYWAIPPALLYLVVLARRETRDLPRHEGLPYEWVYVAFGLFIVACGTTHVMAVWTVWEPRYWISGGVKAVTAAASVATAVALPPLVPRAIALLRDARLAEERRKELEETHAELAGLYERLKEADRLKSELVANVSHELRTPLALILGPVERMLDEERPEKDRGRLEAVHRNASTLESRVDDLLAAARLEAGVMEARWVRTDAGELLRAVAARFESLAADEGTELRVIVPMGGNRVELDREKTDRILSNLVSNGLKFTPPGGQVVAELRGGGDRDGGVTFVVHDSGPGVPEDMREAVFERFRQVRGDARREHGGTGLGLAIAREMARVQGGTVDLDEGPLGGARFTVRLPGRAPAEAEVEEDESPAGWKEVELSRIPAPAGSPLIPDGSDVPAGAPRILLVEDNREMVSHLAEVLGRRYRLSVAYDGQQGLARAVSQPPDLVVTDVMMPRMTGDELVRAIREHDELADVPVLVLTAKADSGLPAELLRSGAQDYVVKPVAGPELLARVANLVDGARARRLLQGELESAEDELGELSRQAVERKRALERSLGERELLLQELHHRVKGNLQTLLSLLRLQAHGLEEPPARRALEAAQGRVAAMALLHERLYAAESPGSLDLGEYVRALAASTLEAERRPDVDVDVTVEADPVRIGGDRAVACGLLVNELLTNAARHAFTGTSGGTVELTVRREGDRVAVRVADDGAGLGGAESGTGLAIVEALARQLGGELSVDGEGGTRATVRFPLEAPAPAAAAVPEGREP